MQGEENWKHHKWDGPAIDPYEGEDSENGKNHIFLNGNEYDEEEYNEIMLRK